MKSTILEVFEQVRQEIKKAESVDQGLTRHSLFCLFCAILCILLKLALSSNKSYFIVGFLMCLGVCSGGIILRQFWNFHKFDHFSENK
jgi:hypothetical protein